MDLLSHEDVSIQVSAEQKVTYSNVGNASAIVGVTGSKWIGTFSGAPRSINGGPEITHIANASNIPYDNKQRIGTPGPVVHLGPGQTGQSFFQLKLPDPIYYGSQLSVAFGIMPHGGDSLHQEVTLDLFC
jgi:hypothetical protein